MENAENNHRSSVTINITKLIMKYFGLAGVFLVISSASIYFVHRVVSEGKFTIDPRFFSIQVISVLLILLILYFLSDGLRLYAVIRAMGFQIPFLYIMKLVFINIFVSNVTPFATGGGVVQMYFITKHGIPIGEAGAATLIRTLLASLILFTLTPVIILLEPNLFSTFSNNYVLYIIIGFSLAYLLVFWLIIMKNKKLKILILNTFLLFRKLNFLKTKRMRKIYLKFSRELNVFSKSFINYFTLSPFWAILSVIFTTMFLLLLFSFSVVLLKAIGYNIPVLTILSFQVVVTFFMYFTPTPGASGVAEGGYGLLFSQLVNNHDITMLTLSWRFLTVYVGVIIGILITYKEILKPKKTKQN